MVNYIKNIISKLPYYKNKRLKQMELISAEKEIVFARLRDEYEDNLLLWLDVYISKVNYMFLIYECLGSYYNWNHDLYNDHLTACRKVWKGINVATYTELYNQEGVHCYKKRKFYNEVFKDIGMVL